MKIAVLGSGPLALEASLHFDQLGASVTIFANNDLGGMVSRVAKFAPETSFELAWSSLTTKCGRDSIGLLNGLEEIPSVGEYFEKYLSSLIKKGSPNIVIKPGSVQRVHKRFLSIDEQVPGKSRLEDLFRVVFTTDPQTSILKQVESNPELFEKLGKDVIDSLNESVESFDDFDIVIDATGSFKDPNPMGPSRSYALNESRINKSSDVYYGRECLKNYIEVTKKSKHIVLVGTGALSALVLSELDLWLEEDKSRMVSLVTTELKPYKDLWESKRCETLALGTMEILKTYYSKLQNDRTQYEKDLFAWRDLEPHVRAKTTEPKEPVSQLNIIPASNVTALDKLLDREGLFATVESHSFRNSGKKSEEYISTLACDAIFVCTGHSKSTDIFNGLRVDFDHDKMVARKENGSHDEPGFYTLGCTTLCKSSLKHGLEQITEIEKEIMNFFSRA
ncbi:hypothetical protein [Halobacteriovorax sp. HLS]|uniref:hypothetical protein n=1 Tax=Halobacteriovorax sp. HLS TaxID=2234000 RepID=UPI000FDCD49B|nr:hypothetical protein [Halobacteriovorax sp. HLS]